MAEPISSYRPTPVRTEPDADEELKRLLETLHEQGVLRMANEFVAAGSPIARILSDGLSSEGARNAVQNLATLLIVLGRIEPAAFYSTATAIQNALRQLGSANTDRDSDAPGLTGIYRMLNDKQLWHDVAPVLDAFKAFTGSLDRPVDKPISDISGKPTQTPEARGRSG